MRTLITGATRFVGRRLTAALQRRGEPVVVLARDPDRARATLGDVEAHRWDAEAEAPVPPAALVEVGRVFHLAGESVGGARWNAKRKARLRDGRVLGTRRLVDALAARPPRVLVSASAIGYYSSRGDDLLDERAPPGDDFLARLCRDWEREAVAATAFGTRVVTPRLGIVLGPGGGALQAMLPPFRLGLGGRLGDGRQWMSWIALDDAVALLLHAADEERLAGPVNAVAPEPVRNADFTRALARALHRPAPFPVPRAALRLLVGEFAEVLLASQRVVPAAAAATGFQWSHPALDDALAAALAST